MAVTGRIHKGIGGFYYVETADGLYECKARGAFRKQRITPLVGDRVEITVNAQGENTIDTILPRKNELRRPPLANLDRLFIVSSLVDPEIRTVQIDKLTVLAAQKGIDIPSQTVYTGKGWMALLGPSRLDRQLKKKKERRYYQNYS